MNNWGIIAVIAFATIGALWVRVLAQSGPLTGSAPPRLNPSPQLTPRVTAQPAPAKTYTNTETYDITWTKDGLPSKIVIHRDAKGS